MVAATHYDFTSDAPSAMPHRIMSKRKLSHQQRRRIAEQREKRRSEKVAQDIIHSETELGELQNGLVMAHFGREALIAGEQSQQRCHLRANLDICTGDRVLWREGEKNGVVESRESRRSVIQRPDIYGKMRDVAANVSQLLITIAPEPEVHTSLIDRYLVAAHLHALTPVILVNKAELIDPEAHEILTIIRRRYSELGYKIRLISAHDKTGLEELQSLLDDNTSIFVGQSGVGKSSLVNALLPDLLPEESARVGALSDAEAKGRHTTTHSQLYPFPMGGYCIDSPGIREFGLWHASANDVLEGFPEIARAAQHCKFRDCAHRSEPGCAIKTAIDEGHIAKQRYQSYQSILSQLDDVTIKTLSGIKNR